MGLEHTNNYLKRRMLTDDGWVYFCRMCGKYIPQTQFYKSSKTPFGIDTKCKLHYSHKKDEKIQMSKLENSDKPIPKKRISPESLQALIRKRIELTLSQIKADAKCSFPRNTFKDIEANRLIPSEEQRRRINLHFSIQLKINTIDV